jgi:hypothetical protein
MLGVNGIMPFSSEETDHGGNCFSSISQRSIQSQELSVG